MERARSLDRSGSQTVKINRTSKWEQMNRPASGSIGESTIANKLQPTCVLRISHR
jgi:hypothetical protein